MLRFISYFGKNSKYKNHDQLVEFFIFELIDIVTARLLAQRNFLQFYNVRECMKLLPKSSDKST